MPLHWLITIITVGTIITLGLWRVILIILGNYFKLPMDICHRSMAIIESVFGVTYAITFGHIHDTVFESANENDWYQTIGMTILLGYFMHDTIYWRYEGAEDVLMLSHHLVTMAGCIYALVLGHFADIVFFYQSSYDGTNVFLHTRYIMRTHGWHRSNQILFQLNELIFIITFFVMRLIIGVHFTFLLVEDTKAITFPTKVISIFLNVINILFYYKVFQMFHRKFERYFDAFF